MKSFRKYLAESVRTYKYKIKIAGEAPKNFINLFTTNLSKFDPVKVGDAKTTPIQKEPYGFPGLKDQSITIIDVEFRYPATEPMIKQMAQLLGYDENLVRMVQATFDDGMSEEADFYANQPSPLLTHGQLEDHGKEASKEYADSYLGRIKGQEQGKGLKNEFATKSEARAAHDPFDVKARVKTEGNKSPMSSIKRPPRPATGAQASGKK